MNEQPLISMADVQWVLHHLPSNGAKVKLLVRRDDQLKDLTLELKPGWRRADDTSWRTGHWILRRSMLGGMKLSSDNDVRRLAVEYVGNWGPFGVAKRAGVAKGDLIYAVDGRVGFERESEVFEYVNQNKRPGDELKLTLRRRGKEVEVRFKVQ